MAIDRVYFKEVKDGPDIMLIDDPSAIPQPMPFSAK